MPVFRYEALNPGGQHANGVIEAESPRDARQRLREQDLHVTSIRGAGFVQQRVSKMGRSRRYGRRSMIAVENVTRQLAMLLDNEVKLTDALGITMAEETDKKMLLALRDIRDRVANGSSIADAIEPHQWLFGRMYISMVRVGETAGNLPQVLHKLADHLRERALRRGQLTTVMIYPVIMLTVTLGVVIFLLTQVFPNIEEAINSSGQELPLPTKMLTVVSDALVAHYPVILAVVVGVIVTGWLLLRTERGGRLRDALALKTPIVGELVRKSQTVHFTSTLHTLLDSGVRMADAMAVLRETTDNSFMRDTINDLRESILRGSDVSTVLRRSRIFPRGVAHMVAVGEQSGELSRVLDRLSTNMNAEVEITVDRLNAALQPILILSLAVVVGFIVLATMLPLLEMGNLQA